MRKAFLGMVIFSVIILASCGGNQVKEVYQKAVEVSEKFENVELKLVVKQKIEDEQLGNVVMDMNTTAQVEMDPFVMFQKGNMSAKMDGLPFEEDIEMYVTENELYMYDAISKSWTKADDVMLPANLSNQDPKGQLEILHPFMDYIEFKEEGNDYIYTFSGKGEEIEDFAPVIIEGYLSDEMLESLGEDITQILELTTIKSIYFEYHIDKETYEIKSVAVELDFDIVFDDVGSTMNIKQETIVEYTGINSIDKIEIPLEVIDTAK